MEIKKDRLEKVIVASYTSPTGNWKLMICSHINKGIMCWDVVKMDMRDNEIVTCHYNGGADESARKAEAYRVYDLYKKKLFDMGKKKRDEEPTPSYRIVEPN